jgi:hypothetical protein
MLRVRGPNGDAVDFDVVTRTLWGPSGTQELSQSDAIRFCADLNFAGIDAWRLPDIKELFGVIDLDSSRFAPAQDRLRSWSDRALSAAFGTSAVYGNTTPYPVRCVSYPQ